VLLEFVWTSKTSTTDADVTTQQEAITSQQPEVVASQQPKAITYQQPEHITHQQIQQNPRADMLMSKTLFAVDMMRITKECAEKEVSLEIIYRYKFIIYCYCYCLLCCTVNFLNNISYNFI
jgi:hypothetical protein